MDELTFWQSAGNQIAKRLPFIERLLEPQMIRRDSKAQADAIRRERQAETDAEVEHTLKMAASSYAGSLVEKGKWTPQQAREFVNYGTIVGKATPLVHPDVDPTKLNDDWIAFFRQRASSFSNDDMQDAFARLLAGEANNPGSFSRATVDTMARMEQIHGQSLQKLRSFSAIRRIGRSGIFLGGGDPDFIPLIFDYENRCYLDRGLNYGALAELESLGIVITSATDFVMTDEFDNAFEFSDARILVAHGVVPTDRISVGKVRLTFIGQQLMNLCEPKTSQEFSKFVVNVWSKRGIEVTKFPIDNC